MKHSFAGAAISGGVDTQVNGNVLPITEFRADQVGGPNRVRSLSGSILLERPQDAAVSQHRSLGFDDIFPDVGNFPCSLHSGFVLFNKIDILEPISWKKVGSVWTPIPLKYTHVIYKTEITCINAE